MNEKANKWYFKTNRGKMPSKHDLVFMDYEFEDKDRNGIDIIIQLTK